MAISGVADYAGYDPDYVPTKAGSELGKDDFLKLIVAQLEYQDPLEPLKSNEFMTQMAAMGQLEQMQNLNANFEEMMTTQGLVYGSQLVGQTVQAIDQSTRSVIEGTVGQVSVDEDGVNVQVGETTVALKDIIAVTPWTSSETILEASRLIGLKVTAMDPNDMLGLSTISGIVDEASLADGKAVLKFSDLVSGYVYEIGLENIISVGQPDESSDEHDDSVEEGSSEGDSEGEGDETESSDEGSRS